MLLTSELWDVQKVVLEWIHPYGCLFGLASPETIFFFMLITCLLTTIVPNRWVWTWTKEEAEFQFYDFFPPLNSSGDFREFIVFMCSTFYKGIMV